MTGRPRRGLHLPGVVLLAVVCLGGRGQGKGPAAPTPRRLSRSDITSWPRASAPEFGCFLEKVFGAKDRRFNCSLKGYVNRGDPCSNTKAYYEGPAFPRRKAGEVHPLADDIRLAWEHGELQEIQVTLARRLTDEEARKAFRLPAPGKLPAHLTRISVQQCSKKATCILVEGFDHMGAGEVDCGTHSKRK